MTVGAPGVFGLDVHNAGSGRAWNLTITDQLPGTVQRAAPATRRPNQFSAQVFQADRVTAVSPRARSGNRFLDDLQRRGLRAVSNSPCSQPVAAIGADERLIVSYETSCSTPIPKTVRPADERRRRDRMVQRGRIDPRNRRRPTRLHTRSDRRHGERARPRRRAHDDRRAAAARVREDRHERDERRRIPQQARRPETPSVTGCASRTWATSVSTTSRSSTNSIASTIQPCSNRGRFRSSRCRSVPTAARPVARAAPAAPVRSTSADLNLSQPE